MHHPVPRAFLRRLHQFEQKGIGQAGEQKQPTTMFPRMQARAFKREFVFARAPHLLDLPASGGGKDQRPETVGAGDRLNGQQIPRREVVIGPAHDQPETLGG